MKYLQILLAVLAQLVHTDTRCGVSTSRSIQGGCLSGTS